MTEAADYLRISERQLAREVRRGQIPSSLLGRRRLFHSDQLDAFAAAREDVAPTTSPRHRRE
jgi:excisionase family DNA binding protein